MRLISKSGWDINPTCFTDGKTFSAGITLTSTKLIVFFSHGSLTFEFATIARPLGLHYNHYVSLSVCPWSVSENAQNF